MKSVAEGEMEITPGFVEEMYFCLDCQACETACPAGVKYGSLVEASRAQIEEQNAMGTKNRILKSVFLAWLFSSEKRLKSTARLLRFYQSSGLGGLLRNTSVLDGLSPKLSRLQEVAPRISAKFSDEFLPEIVPAEGRRKYRVGFLTGCLMNVMYADVNDDTVRVLAKNNCEVVIPRGQICCGSLQAHNGMIKTARRLARKTIESFESYRLDSIVTNSAGCGAFMKEYGDLLVEDDEYSLRARKLSGKVKDFSEFLMAIDFVQPQVPIHKRVTYHEACHLVHSQKISDQPKQLLKMIPGLELVQLEEATWCCGSAGIYNIIRFEDSMKLLKRKMDNIEQTGAEIVALANPGCHGQIEYGAKKGELKVEVLHLATLLRRAYGS